MEGPALPRQNEHPPWSSQKPSAAETGAQPPAPTATAGSQPVISPKVWIGRGSSRGLAKSLYIFLGGRGSPRQLWSFQSLSLLFRIWAQNWGAKPLAKMCKGLAALPHSCLERWEPSYFGLRDGDTQNLCSGGGYPGAIESRLLFVLRQACECRLGLVSSLPTALTLVGPEP